MRRVTAQRLSTLQFGGGIGDTLSTTNGTIFGAEYGRARKIDSREQRRAIKMANCAISSHTTTHVDVQYHPIRQMVQQRKMNVMHICTERHFITKALDPTHFSR